jgi:hypothetical protein
MHRDADAITASDLYLDMRCNQGSLRRSTWPGAYDTATISRFTASGQERLRCRPVGIVSITGFVDTSRPHNTKNPRHAQ